MKYSVAEFLLPTDLETFIKFFWRSKEFYIEFLEEKLLDKHVKVGDWKTESKINNNEEEEKENSNLSILTKRRREIHSHHPSKISFPGLPAHAESFKTQIITYSENEQKLSILEKNHLKGIPYSDYFAVHIEWCCTEDGLGGTRAEIFVSFDFHKSTWLQGTIESNTCAELKDVYELWYEHALNHMTKIEQLRIDASDVVNDGNVNNALLVGGEVQQSSLRGHGSGYTLDSEDGGSGSGSNYHNDVTSGTDDDDSFYDCEESAQINSTMSLLSPHNPSAQSNNMNMTNMNVNTRMNHDISEAHFNNMSTSQRLAMIFASRSSDSYDHHGHTEGYNYAALEGGIKISSPSSHHHHITPHSDLVSSSPRSLARRTSYTTNTDGEHRLTDITGNSPATVKDVVVTLVETVFVICEFSFWRIYSLYQYDMKDAFNVKLHQIIWRAFMSFIPGRHSDIMQKPDIYGPLVATLTLPLVVLLCLQVNDLGCSRSEMLKTAIVTSFCLWWGLSSLYLLVAWLLTPIVTLRHCLCMTGYSFYPWILAISCSYCLEVGLGLDKPHSVPLILFGIPSSIALGYLFWEHTPASAMALRTATLPPSLQACATQNSRLLQKLIAIVPKLLGFIFVAATHYQFLWYLARVFLPGRRQMCRLSAIIKPAVYADILTQKELLSFAEWLLNAGQ